MNSSSIEKAIAAKVIDPEVHRGLLGDLEFYTNIAGIPSSMVLKPMSDFCGEEEQNYVSRYRSLPDADIFGLIYTGQANAITAHTKMMAMTGAYLRNFIDARLLSVQDVIRMVKGHETQPTVLLIPNFFIQEGRGGRQAQWEIPELLGLLLDRHAAEKQTVVYVDSVVDMAKEYGPLFAAHFSEYFVSA